MQEIKKSTKISTKTMILIKSKMITSQIQMLRDFIDSQDLFEDLWNVEDSYNFEWNANKPNQTYQFKNSLTEKKDTEKLIEESICIIDITDEFPEEQLIFHQN